MAAANKKVTLTKEKETPGTWRYAEVTENGADPVLRTVYLPKALVEELGKPTTISVTITAA